MIVSESSCDPDVREGKGLKLSTLLQKMTKRTLARASNFYQEDPSEAVVACLTS